MAKLKKDSNIMFTRIKTLLLKVIKKFFAIIETLDALSQRKKLKKIIGHVFVSIHKHKTLRKASFVHNIFFFFFFLIKVGFKK